MKSPFDLRLRSGHAVALGVALTFSADAAQSGQPLAAAAQSANSLEAAQVAFLRLKFGMFIHFNMATYQGVEWVEGYPDPAAFDPGGWVDTDAWAETALAAGMKYAVLTAKHVGGFCLWDSRLTTYDVNNPRCRYQQDLVGQFVRSFRRRGLKVGLYYCWRHPGFGVPSKYKVLPPECDPATHSLEEQIAFQKAQVAELVERYPEVFYVWNDGLDPAIMSAAEAQAFFRSVRPGLLASANWWDWAKKGTPYLDIAVTEMRHFPENNTLPNETCWKLEPTWFWRPAARPMSADQVLHLLQSVNHRHANLLLNVTPNRHGRFEIDSLDTLLEVGRRLRAQNARNGR